MATTYTLINKSILSGTQSSITFTAIPSTYTDLLIKVSARDDNSASANGSYYIIYFNGSSTSYSDIFLRGNGSSVGSGSFAQYAGNSVTTAQTSNTFSNDEIYIPNYAGSTNKTYSADAVVENNATGAFATFNAGLWSNTAAITSVKIEAANGGANLFQIGSSFYLYGIKNS
jgi:hypothetical protein